MLTWQISVATVACSVWPKRGGFPFHTCNNAFSPKHRYGPPLISNSTLLPLQDTVLLRIYTLRWTESLDEGEYIVCATSSPPPGLPSWRTVRKRMRAASFSSGLHAEGQANANTSTYARTHTHEHAHERTHARTKHDTTTKLLVIHQMTISRPRSLPPPLPPRNWCDNSA